MLCDIFKKQFSNTETLTGMILDNLTYDATGETSEPIDLSSAPDDCGVAREHIGQVAQRNDTDMEDVLPCLAEVYRVNQRSTGLAQTVATIEPAQADEEIRSTCEDATGILAGNRHWRTSGFKPVSLETLGYKEYKKMAYVTCDRIALSKVRELKIQTLLTREEGRPLSDPRGGLADPPQHSGWVRPTDSDLAPTVQRRDTRDRKSNWEIGVESGSRNHHSCELFHPGNLNPKRIPCTTLTCEGEMQVYNTVNLSRPPENGFRHVKLIVSPLPTLGKSDMPTTQLMFNSRQTFSLGPVTTAQNVKGLLLRKIFSNDVQLLQQILALHTSLQVHPFVPRTFALHLMKTPFSYKSAVGMFVGEAAGEWNLGCARGMSATTETARFTLAYHVLRCLLRVQILCLRVLGFTLKCIQPARIWRWRTGFRADFISCLADTVYMWHNADLAWGGPGGLATIQFTMQQLGLFQYLPDRVKSFVNSSAVAFQKNVRLRDSVLERPYAQARAPCTRDDFRVLYTAYNLCTFTEQTISDQSGLDVILGTDRYEEISLETMGLVVQPYGPFYIQIHHQHFKWNEAVVVEPLLNGPGKLAQVLFVFGSKERGRLVKAHVLHREQVSQGRSPEKTNPKAKAKAKGKEKGKGKEKEKAKAMGSEGAELETPRYVPNDVNTQKSIYSEY